MFSGTVLKMTFFPALFVLISVAGCDAELNLEAAEGENFTVSFKTAGMERADQVKITLTRGRQKNLIAQYCRCVHRGDCDVVETAGVLLRVEEGTFTLLRVRSNNTGLYKVIIFTGSNVSEIQVTLVVNKPALSSSREPTQTSSKPPDFSERHRLHVLAAPVVFILGVLGVYLLYIWKRGCDAEAARDPV